MGKLWQAERVNSAGVCRRTRDQEVAGGEYKNWLLESLSSSQLEWRVGLRLKRRSSRTAVRSLHRDSPCIGVDANYADRRIPLPESSSPDLALSLAGGWVHLTTALRGMDFSGLKTPPDVTANACGRALVPAECKRLSPAFISARLGLKGIKATWHILKEGWDPLGDWHTDKGFLRGTV